MKMRLIVLCALLSGSCASTDSFNRLAANLTRDAITATEQNRCTVHAQPCLSDDQFKGANVELNKISVAGREYTKLRIAGTASAKDAHTFLATVAEETAILAKTYTTGGIAAALAKLTELQSRAVKLLGGQ